MQLGQQQLKIYIDNVEEITLQTDNNIDRNYLRIIKILCKEIKDKSIKIILLNHEERTTEIVFNSKDHTWFIEKPATAKKKKKSEH